MPPESIVERVDLRHYELSSLTRPYRSKDLSRHFHIRPRSARTCSSCRARVRFTFSRHALVLIAYLQNTLPQTREAGTTMRLIKLSYSEFSNTPYSWILNPCELDATSLIVGKNAAGKTRFLNVINGLAGLLSGANRTAFKSGEYSATFGDGDTLLQYEIFMEGNFVVREFLTRDGEELLSRKSDGTGEIWSERLKIKLEFETPKSLVAASARKDAIQHPFLSGLFEWSSRVRMYQFGTSLGRDILGQPAEVEAAFRKTASPAANNTNTTFETQNPFDSSRAMKIYVEGFAAFGKPFDEAIIRDMCRLGYECTDIGVTNINSPILDGPPLIQLFVQEKDLPVPTGQIVMSQGMFRALAIVIHLTDMSFRKDLRTLLIDDIGEGLDYCRAQAMVSLLLERTRAAGSQLLMTTNDRFIMNGVPLDYWGVLKRTSNSISMINKKNSESIFREFEDLGLNNFDFFSTGFFDKGAL